MKLNALYVGTTNMQRSLAFYQDVFQREPVQKEERFSMFGLGGAYFGLFNAAYDGETLTFGNNCVPNIEVEDLDEEYKRIRPLAPKIDVQIRKAGTYRYFQFADPDGNLVELYEVGGDGVN